MSKINVISHRGANRYAPQNTLPAFKRAAEIGVDGFETDVHITKDNKLVLCHNYTIDATSDGEGEISNLTLAQLERFDFGKYFAPKFRDTKIPTLDEYLDFIATTDISVLNIELKSPKANETAIVKETIRLVKEHDLFDKLLISSFDPKLLVEAKQIDPKCKTGYLYDFFKKIAWKNKAFTKYIEFAKEIKADALHPIYLCINEAYVKKAHEAGLMVNAWTVDSIKQIEKMIACKVDGIITDFPDVTKGIVEKYC